MILNQIPYLCNRVPYIRIQIPTPPTVFMIPTLLLVMELAPFFFSSQASHCLWASQSACASADHWPLVEIEHGQSYTSHPHGEHPRCSETISPFHFHIALVCIAKNLIPLRLTFLIAEACLIAGATKNAYHTKYRDMVYAQNWTCESLRKGVFIAGAVFVVFTMILNVYYYMYFTKATSQAAHKANRASSTVGMAGYT